MHLKNHFVSIRSSQVSTAEAIRKPTVVAPQISTKTINCPESSHTRKPSLSDPNQDLKIGRSSDAHNGRNPPM